MRRLFTMRMFWIMRIWSISPNIGKREAFALKLRRKFFLVHHLILAFPQTPAPDTTAPSFRPPLAVRGNEGAPSSGEKIVYIVGEVAGSVGGGGGIGPCFPWPLGPESSLMV